MSNELERVALALHAEACNDPECDHTWTEWEREAQAAITAMTPTPQVETAATHPCGELCRHRSDCGLHNAPACYESGNEAMSNTHDCDPPPTPQVVEDFRAIIREFTEYAKPTGNPDSDMSSEDWEVGLATFLARAMHPTPDVDSTCTCPSGDGSLRWPCPQHPPTPQADVLAEVRAHCVTQRDAIRATYDPSVTPYHY